MKLKCNAAVKPAQQAHIRLLSPAAGAHTPHICHSPRPHTSSADATEPRKIRRVARGRPLGGKHLPGAHFRRGRLIRSEQLMLAGGITKRQQQQQQQAVPGNLRGSSLASGMTGDRSADAAEGRSRRTSFFPSPSSFSRSLRDILRRCWGRGAELALRFTPPSRIPSRPLLCLSSMFAVVPAKFM